MNLGPLKLLYMDKQKMGLLLDCYPIHIILSVLLYLIQLVLGRGVTLILQNATIYVRKSLFFFFFSLPCFFWLFTGVFFFVFLLFFHFFLFTFSIFCLSLLFLFSFFCFFFLFSSFLFVFFSFHLFSFFHLFFPPKNVKLGHQFFHFQNLVNQKLEYRASFTLSFY